MKKPIICAFLLLFFVLSVANTALADELSELKAELKALKSRVSELEAKVADKEAAEKRAPVTAQQRIEHTDTHILHRCPECGIQAAGFKMAAGATLIGQYAIDPNTATGDNEALDGTYSIDIEIEKQIGKDGLAFIHLEAGEGGGLDGDEITTFSAVNRDAGDTGTDVDVTEVWYEHNFFDGRLVATEGKLDPTAYLDQNAIANDETTQFLGSIFRNSTALEFPDDNTYGFRVTYLPFDWLELGGGLFDDNADWEDLFEDRFMFGQVNVKPGLMEREGSYRVYGWYDDSNHTKWLNPTATTKQNFGFGTSSDQELTDILTVFARFGWESPKVSMVEWAWSTGFQLDGAPWKRDKDYLGFAVGMDIPSGDYEDAGMHGEPEGHIEAYYNFHVNDNLHISPDYQFIWSPYGDDNDDPISIIGARGQIDF